MARGHRRNYGTPETVHKSAISATPCQQSLRTELVAPRCAHLPGLRRCSCPRLCPLSRQRVPRLPPHALRKHPLNAPVPAVAIRLAVHPRAHYSWTVLLAELRVQRSFTPTGRHGRKSPPAAPHLEANPRKPGSQRVARLDVTAVHGILESLRWDARKTGHQNGPFRPFRVWHDSIPQSTHQFVNYISSCVVGSPPNSRPSGRPSAVIADASAALRAGHQLMSPPTTQLTISLPKLCARRPPTTAPGPPTAKVEKRAGVRFRDVD